MVRRFDVRRQTGFNTIALTCFALLYLPIAVMVVFAFNDGLSMSDWEGFSLRWFRTALDNPEVVDAALLSLQVAAVSAVLATVVATLAAVATTRTAPYRGLTFKVTFLSVPLVVPEIVTAVSLLIFFAQIKVATGYTGLGYLIAAHTAFCLPFAYLPIRARLQHMDPALERAAGDLYATPLAAFRHVTLPLLWPGILAGLMLAFVISLDDVVITEFVKSAGQETLPTYMLGAIRRNLTPEVNAISALFLLPSVALVTLFFLFSRRNE